MYYLVKRDTHLYKSEISGQAACNKMAVDPIQDVLKDFKNLEKALKLVSVVFYQFIILIINYNKLFFILILIFSPNDSPSKTMKNVFYFI